MSAFIGTYPPQSNKALNIYDKSTSSRRHAVWTNDGADSSLLRQIWPASYCRQRIVSLAAAEVQLPRDWLLPNTIDNPPYIPQLSEDEEAELRLFVHTATHYVFRDYRTCSWIRMACAEMFDQRRNEPELWLAKYNTANDDITLRRQGMKDRWLKWRQETTERRERLEVAQRQRLVSDEDIAGWEDG